MATTEPYIADKNVWNQKRVPGDLVFKGHRPYGHESYDFYRCPDCRTDFPVLYGQISCNGCAISSCPWCTPKVRIDVLTADGRRLVSEYVEKWRDDHVATARCRARLSVVWYAKYGIVQKRIVVDHRTNTDLFTIELHPLRIEEVTGSLQF